MDPVDYRYMDSATFSLKPFEVLPVECLVSYTCHEPIYNLCNYESETTSASFDAVYGVFTFTSNDVATFGT